MSNTNTGGPAFPNQVRITDEAFADLRGMTLRDYFAAKATEEDIAAHIWKGHKEDFVMADGYGMKKVVKREAMWSREEAKYRYADAMLKAREA
jgi:hypothetical protein